MSIIQVLSDVEAKKIAAGEVVERPASVVKELVENSLDAGATKISLYIERSGKSLIRVVDNGCGMVLDDAKRCFVNHATSKVSSLDDLQQLSTFGFRGEALASISSVSKVMLTTRYNKDDHQEETGIRLEYVDGRVACEEVVACPLGTDLSIKEIFYNTPVRQKFLKQDETEWNQIQSLFQACSLSHLPIHFTLYRDRKMVLNAPPVDNVKDRVMQLWGHNLGQNLVSVLQEKKHDVQVTGLISRHNFWRYGRQQIFFFVNGRWVKNVELSKALMKGYKNVLPPARFPSAFLFLTLDTLLVDINVHPRKEEVRFAKPVTVANVVQGCVTHTLEGLVSAQLRSVQDVSAPDMSALDESAPDVSATDESVPDVSVVNEFVPGVSVPGVSVPGVPVSSHNVFQKDVVGSVVQPEAATGKIIGQLLNTYIVVENEDGLLLIDQHAAHERILYEKYLKNFEQKEGTRLLFPEVIRLNHARCESVLRQQEFFARQGIEIERLSDEEVAVKTSPPKIESKSLRELIFEMVEFIEQNGKLDVEEFRKKLNEHMHSQMACKMAVKAGDVLSVSMMRNIVLQLQQVDNRFICVHGRPTTWGMSTAELEKTFRRR